MKIDFHRDWESWFKKLRPAQKDLFYQRLELFMQNPHDPSLNNHPLHGVLKDFRTINVGGDLRGLFRRTAESYIFYRVGTHHQLYQK